MAGRLRKKACAVIDRPAFGIIGRIIEPADTGERQCACAHRTRFKRDIEITADQPFAAQDPRTGPQHQHFGMGGRILIAQDPIARTGNDRSVSHQNGSNRHFTGCGGLSGFVKGQIQS